MTDQNPESPKPRLFVTGAGGQLGRRVVELLLDAGADVVAGSRDPSKLADLEAGGAQLRPADFDDPDGLAQAFVGVDRLLIISVLDTPHDPPLRLRQHQAAVTAAAKAGVKHITYTSMQKPDAESPIPFAADHRGTEAAIEATGIPYTILRPNWYADIAFFWVPPVLASGQWFTAAGDGRVAYLWRDDLARAAAASLLAGGTDSRKLDISGGEALSPAEIIAAVNDIFGIEAKAVPVSVEDLAAGLRAAGLPEPQVAIFSTFDENTRLGRVDSVNGNFEALTGQQPRGLREYLTANRDALLAASKAS